MKRYLLALPILAGCGWQEPAALKDAGTPTAGLTSPSPSPSPGPAQAPVTTATVQGPNGVTVTVSVQVSPGEPQASPVPSPSPAATPAGTAVQVVSSIGSKVEDWLSDHGAPKVLKMHVLWVRVSPLGYTEMVMPE